MTLIGLFPFYRAYQRVHDLMGFTRTKSENIYFSADALSFLCSASFNRLYGPWTQKFCKPEGILFPGLVAATLAGLAIARLGRAGASDRPGLRVVQRVLLVGTLALALLQMAPASMPSDWNFEFFIHPWSPGLQRLMELLFGACFLLSWVVLFVRKRSVLQTAEGRTTAFYTAMLITAVVLALGPVLHFGGRRLGWGPYVWLFQYVPGFRAMRVPARVMAYGMMALAVLAGLAVDRWRRLRLWGPVLTVLVVLEGWHVPLPMAWVPPPEEVPAVYRWLRQEAEPGTPVVEVPIGRDPTRLKYTEFRYMYFQAFHGHPTVNGMSGFFPEAYRTLQDLLHSGHFSAWVRALGAIGVRYVVVHTEAVEPSVVEALRRQPGVRTVATLGSDVVLALDDVQPLRDSDLPRPALPLRLPRWAPPGAAVVAAVEFPDDRVFLFRPPRNRLPVRVEFQDLTSGRVVKAEPLRLTLPHLVTPFQRWVSLRVTTPEAVGAYRLRIRSPSGDVIAEGRLEVRVPPPASSKAVLRAEYLRVELPTGYADHAFGKGGLGRARIRNVGDAVWYSTGDAPSGRKPYGVWVRWRLFDRWGEFLAEGRSVLPFDVPPGDEVEVAFTVEGFNDAGPYGLSLEVVPDESAALEVRDPAWAVDRWDVRGVYRERRPESMRQAAGTTPGVGKNLAFRPETWHSGKDRIYYHRLPSAGNDAKAACPTQGRVKNFPRVSPREGASRR